MNKLEGTVPVVFERGGNVWINGECAGCVNADGDWTAFVSDFFGLFPDTIRTVLRNSLKKWAETELEIRRKSKRAGAVQPFEGYLRFAGLKVRFSSWDAAEQCWGDGIVYQISIGMFDRKE